MDLETEAKLRFLNHEGPRVWFLTDLHNGTVIQLPQTAKPNDYICDQACENRAYLHTKFGLIFEFQLTISFEVQTL